MNLTTWAPWANCEYVLADLALHIPSIVAICNSNCSFIFCVKRTTGLARILLMRTLRRVGPEGFSVRLVEKVGSLLILLSRPV
jgi:hypothetical protein